MRIGYLECFAGIAGDMFLGALLDAGVPPEVMQRAVASLKIGAGLKIETVDRSGISACKVHVLEQVDDAHVYTQQQQETPARSMQPQTQHLHKTGHAHTHEPQEHSHEQEHSHDGHTHSHGRSLTVIRGMIQSAALAQEVKDTAIRAFELLGYSEAKIHNVPVDDIHFHEVGAVDAIVDIVACSAGIHHLKVGAWYSTPVNVGGGMVQCAHGNFPVPAPATADLLRGMPTYSAHVQKELTTPTGAALLRALNPSFGAQPAMQVEAIGYGAGTRNPAGFPNVLRLSVGEVETEARSEGDTVTVLETALDDLSPQVLAYVAEKALGAGALDVMMTPVVMKKGRAGTLLTVLCDASQSGALTQLLLRETSTLGVRSRLEKRVCLDRTHAEVNTAYGAIRMKIGSSGGQERNAAPEFEDCRAAAERSGVPLKQVQQAAVAAWQNKA